MRAYLTNLENQGFWAPGGATLRLPPRMRLAPSERERLWKGLERFVNCGDSESDYQALGRAFPDFWPSDISHFPNQESIAPAIPAIRIGASEILDSKRDYPREMSDEEYASVHRMDSLSWHKACHNFFLFHRDTLRDIWSGKEETAWLGGGREEFLLGLSNLNMDARDAVKEGDDVSVAMGAIPFLLDKAWQEILGQFPTAFPEGGNMIGMLWKSGEFYLLPRGDFQRAFYLLFRQSWRARVCPRCKMFFIARRPKQRFCGTVCSAGSRLASKRKWWRSVGSRNRKRVTQLRKRRRRVKGANR
jgi:hypothetical protein